MKVQAIMSNVSPNVSKRIFGLDILRAVAITLVVLFHSSPLLQPLTKSKVIGKPVLIYIKTLIWIGPIAVDLFFVLSGFLIGTILIRVFLETDKYRLPVIWEFWIKRWFRTLPNYLFLLTAGFVLYFWLYHDHLDWRYYLFLQNFNHRMPVFFGETWSLSVEEWTYLLLPVALLLISRLFFRAEKRMILKYTILLYLLVTIGIRFFKIYQQGYHDLDEEIRKVTIYRLDSIIYGVAAAYFIQYHKEKVFLYKKWLLYIGLSVLILTLSVTFLLLHIPGAYHIDSTSKIITDTLFFTLIPVSFSLLLPASYFFKRANSRIFEITVTHTSLISYSLYLLHNTLIFIPFFAPLVILKSNLAIFGVYLVYIMVVFIAASFNFKYFEKPTTQLRESYIKNRDKRRLKIKI